MKKIFLVFILMSVIFTSLIAKSFYIKVMSTSNNDAIFSVKYNLDELGYKIYLNKYNNLYRVYTGPFKNQNEADKALVEIQKSIAKNTYVVRLKMSDNKIISSVPKPQPKETAPVKVSKSDDEEMNNDTELQQSQAVQLSSLNEQEIKEEIVEQSSTNSENSNMISESKKDNSFFIGLAAGLSTLSFQEKNINGTVPLNFELKDSGINYGIEAGYNFNKNIFMTINYQKTDEENIYFNHAFSTLNYKFNGIYSIFPYLGILGGYGNMTWKNSPIDSTVSRSSCYSFLYGAQAGSIIQIYGDVSMFIFYRYLMMDYKTSIKIITAEKEIEHNVQQNLNIGLQYSF